MKQIGLSLTCGNMFRISLGHSGCHLLLNKEGGGEFTFLNCAYKSEYSVHMVFEQSSNCYIYLTFYFIKLV